MPFPPKKPASPDPAQLEFDGVFRLGNSKQNLTVQEVAKGLGISVNQVRDLVDTGEFCDACIGDAPLENRQREHLRITRFSVVAWFRERLAERGHDDIPFHQTPEVLHWRKHLQALKATRK